MNKLLKIIIASTIFFIASGLKPQGFALAYFRSCENRGACSTDEAGKKTSLPLGYRAACCTGAHSPTADSSASLTLNVKGLEKEDERVGKLRVFLDSYDSPLKDFATDFVSSADKYGVDWKLVPSITGVESTFGRFIPAGSYNAYGWANGSFYFKSWPESIEIVTKTLKERYINRGADTVEEIAPIYAPPSKTWAGKVRSFMTKLENFDRDPDKLPLLKLSL